MPSSFVFFSKLQYISYIKYFVESLNYFAVLSHFAPEYLTTTAGIKIRWFQKIFRMFPGLIRLYQQLNLVGKKKVASKKKKKKFIKSRGSGLGIRTLSG